jgi:hypothetical protein
MPEVVEVILEPRCFYVIAGPFRYSYSHAILGPDQAPQLIPEAARIAGDEISRRISVMFRDEKQPDIV